MNILLLNSLKFCFKYFLGGILYFMLMNKIYVLFIANWLIIHAISLGQQVISSNGGIYQSEQIYISWSSGEPVTQTLTGSIVLTQGFQQPSGTILYQLLNIPSGWSGISTYLNLTDTGFETIFEPYQSLIILSSMSGIYYPSQSINTLGDWDYFSGYQVKAENTFTLNLAGYSFGDAVLDVDQGWNLMPVLSHCAVSIEDLFQGQESVIIAKEVAGSNLYWPAYGINTLGEFLPGKSYYVAFETAETITFPQCSNSFKDIVNSSTDRLISPWNDIKRNAASHSIAVPASTLAESAFSAGDILGVFTSEGICAGAVEIINPEKSIAVTAYGNDDITAGKNGFYAGELLDFKIYKPEYDQDFNLEVEYDLSLPQSGNYVPNGISAVSAFKSGVALAGTGSIKALSLYPNPTAGKVFLKMNAWPRDLSVKITNAQQSLIAEYQPEESDLQEYYLIDLGSKPSGVYFFMVSGDDFFDVRKVILH